MTEWIKKLHMYAGLLNFTILMVFGVAGLAAAASLRRHFDPQVTMHAFTAPANLDDYQVAEAAFQSLKPLGAMPDRSQIRRNADNQLTFTVYTPSGPTVCTLLEAQQQLRVEFRREEFWHYLDNLHATTRNPRIRSTTLQMWGWYTEFSIVSLVFMSLSGVYLWLASRPGYRWAQVSFAAGCGAFLLAWVVTR